MTSALFQLTLFTLVPLLWWLVTGRKEHFLKWIGLRKPVLKCGAAKLVLLSAAVSAAYIAGLAVIMKLYFQDVETAVSQFAGRGVSAFPAILVYAVIQTSLSEEILFRGFLGKRLISRFGFSVGNAVQALCFGLIHGVPFFLGSGNVVVLIALTIMPGLIGWYEGYMNEKLASGSIVPSWIMHAVLNVLSAGAACI